MSLEETPRNRRPDSYPINNQKLRDWIYEDPTRERILFAENLTHISYNDFYEKIIKIYYEIIELCIRRSDRTVYFIIGNNERKSGYWCSMILASIFTPADNVDIKFIKKADDIFNSVSDNVLCVHCDDASYSGKQIVSYLPSIMRVNMTYLICIPYMTNVAYKKIKKHIRDKKFTLLFSKHEIMPTWKEITKGQKSERLGGMKETILDIRDGHTLYYFDHKLADIASVPTKLMLKFITGCDEDDYIEEQSTCPPRVYAK
jgi:hypothetical protein